MVAMKSKFFIVTGFLLLVGFLAFLLALRQSTSPLDSIAIQLIPCSHKPTPSQIEGPYYKNGSPEKVNFYGKNISGNKFTLTGYVLNTKCQPITHAWVAFWQANANGQYDNEGYTLRGYQYTDSNGKYTLSTVVPGMYPGRTPHIHVKVRATSTSPVLTTQLYFPGLESNSSDAIYNPALQIQNVKDTKAGKSATFNFILNQ